MCRSLWILWTLRAAFVAWSGHERVRYGNIVLMEQERKTTIVRSELSEREWVRFRKLALDENEPAAKIIGRLMREYLELRAPEPLAAAEQAASGVRLPKARRG